MHDHPIANEFEDQIREAVRVPEASPEFVSRLRGELARRPARARPGFVFRPAWAFALALAIVILAAASLPGVVNAVRQWFGFVPGLGLVEQHSTLRILEQPVFMQRDGVTVTVEQVLAYPDRVELMYSAQGISGGADPGGVQCGGPESYPYLSLPDGSLLGPDRMPKGGRANATGYNMGHSYPTSIPPEISQATFLLTCLQNTSLGKAPENWAIPFTLVDAPEGYTAGQPVSAGEPAEIQAPQDSPVIFDFVGGAAEEDGVHFFFHFSMPSDDPTFLAVSPAAVYVIDSSGAKIDVINTLPWSPYDQVDVWEYRTAMPPADGPLTLVIEGAQVYYMAQDAAFEFAPGPDPQIGQIWDLAETFTIGGQPVSVRSAKMVEMDGHKGFEFTIESENPSVEISAEVLDLTSAAPEYSLWSTTRVPAPGRSVTTGFVYEDAVPESLTVTFNTLSVLHNGSWKVDWTPPAK